VKNVESNTTGILQRSTTTEGQSVILGVDPLLGLITSFDRTGIFVSR
jgi:hypothetical protein